MRKYEFGYDEVKAAYERIRPYLKETPLDPSFYLGGDGKKYYFKLESFQPVKSFKVRGALNKMLTLTEEERRRGVCTISSGNHGSSVSYAASLLGIEKAEIIVPETAPKSKVERIEYFGGHVLQIGETICDAVVGGVGALSYALLKDYCNDLIEIREESAARAVSFMAKQEKYIVEPSSALTVAAVMDHGDRIGGTNIALVLSGGNIDGNLLTELMSRY